MTALLTAAPQHIAPSRSSHTNSKAVRFCPAPAVGLKGTFQDAMLPAWISCESMQALKIPCVKELSQAGPIRHWVIGDL
jgi:hypothetical protein